MILSLMINRRGKYMGKYLIAFMMASVSQYGTAAMKALEDETLSGVSGQSGLTLDIETNISIGEVAYFDDGLGIALQGVRLTKPSDRTQADWERYIRHELSEAGGDPAYADRFPFEENTSNLSGSRVELDILNNGTLALDIFTIDRARFEIENIRFVDAPGLSPGAADRSFGGLFFDFQLDGYVEVTGAGTDGSGIFGGLYNIDLLFENARFGYRTNGNEFFLDGMTIDFNSPGTVLTFDYLNDELNVRLPNLSAEISVDALRFSNNPSNHGVSYDVDSGTLLPSYGSLWAFMELNANLQLRSGGEDGQQGVTFNAQTAINWLDLAWGDDIVSDAAPGWIAALGITGDLNIQNMAIDILEDPDAGIEPAKDYGRGLAFSFERMQANLHIQDFVIADSMQRIRAYSQGRGGLPVRTIGSFNANLLFADGMFGGNPRTNRIYLQAGGNLDAGYQGLRLDTQLSVISPNNESNFVYTDNGNSLMWSRFQAYADGDLTLDITNAGTINGTQFYDGLRLGFEDFAFGYQIDGYRVARSTGDANDLNNQELQGAAAVPGMPGFFSIGAAPALEGNLNGHVTLGAGGRFGEEGLTINADLSISNGSLATYVDGDGTGRGLWLSGLNYDVHLRDMMIDVTDLGMEIYESEHWSTLDVTDFRIGDKVTGASFGRIAQETYELGSQHAIRAGGAGDVCLGGSGFNQAQCEGSGGAWNSRGSEGLTVISRRHLSAESVVENKRNRFTWELGRTGEGTAAVVNGSGMQLVFDNFTTNDGNGLTDTYGIQAVSHVDIAQTRVVKKSDGADRNGVVGNRGDEKVMNADGTYRYVAPASMSETDRNDRPVGLAVRTSTSFREIDFDRVNLVHPAGGESTLLYGLKFQNFDVTTDITATPMD